MFTGVERSIDKKLNDVVGYLAVQMSTQWPGKPTVILAMSKRGDVLDCPKHEVGRA